MSNLAGLSSQGTRERADAGYTTMHYDLSIDYRVASNRLDGVAVITARATAPLSVIVLDFVGLRVTDILVGGVRPAKWRHRGRTITIQPQAALEPGVEFEVTVTYSGTPGPYAGPWGDVGWEELADGVIVASQPDGARTWFPCHDTPADKATFRFAVTVESPFTVVCNGRLVSRTVRAARVLWVYEMTEPMAPYLATVQVGRYTSTVLATAPLTQIVVTPPGLRDNVLLDLAQQPRMMESFCDLFGPYPFDDYTVVVTQDVLEIPVEAQALAVFGSNHLDGTGRWERLIAHELAHQWFGNSLTVGRWSEIWLHEGFACYAEWLWSEASGSLTAHQRALLAHERLTELPQDLVIGNPDDGDMFDDRLYKRGALTLHALRLTVGDEKFFAVLRAWVAENRHGTISTRAFVATTQRVCGESFEELFTSWLDGPSLPSLPVALATPMPATE